MEVELVWVQVLQVVLWQEEEVAAAGLQLMKLVLSSASFAFASWAFWTLLVLSFLGLPSFFSTERTALPFAEEVFSLDRSVTCLETGTCNIKLLYK